MSCDSDGYVSVESSRRHRARKAYTCLGCNGPIRPGDLYVYTFQIFDGDRSAFRHCLRCDALIAAIAERQRELRIDIGVQWDLNCGHSWQDIMEEEPPAEILRLAFLTPDEMQQEFGHAER